MYSTLHANKDYDIRALFTDLQIADLQAIYAPKGWTRVMHSRSLLFRLRCGKRFPTIKLGIDSGIRVEVDTLGDNKEVRSTTQKFKSVADALPLVERLFTELLPNASTTTHQ